MVQQQPTKDKGTPPARVTAPVSSKAPRIMVAESNRSVESQVIAAGGCVVDASWNIERAIEDLAVCDGLVITGGGDVNPALYGQSAHGQVYGTSSSRDLRELALLGAARDLNLPVLGICRGMQIIAVEAGGTLYQHVPDKVHHDNHSCAMMPVRTVRGSLLQRTCGEFPNMLHLHHQAVKRVPRGFIVSAHHPDGLIEGIESNDGRVIGVQFHPESVMGKASGHVGWKLFDAFTSAATRYRRRVRANGRPTLQPAEKYTTAWPVAKEAFAKRVAYSADYYGDQFGSSAKQPVKVTDKRHDQGKLVELRPKSKEVAKVEDVRPVGWCGPCGVAFDFINDYVDHVDFFHPGTALSEEVIMCYLGASDESYSG